MHLCFFESHGNGEDLPCRYRFEVVILFVCPIFWLSKSAEKAVVFGTKLTLNAATLHSNFPSPLANRFDGFIHVMIFLFIVLKRLSFRQKLIYMVDSNSRLGIKICSLGTKIKKDIFRYEMVMQNIKSC